MDEKDHESTDDFAAVGVIWGIILGIPIWGIIIWIVKTLSK